MVSGNTSLLGSSVNKAGGQVGRAYDPALSARTPRALYTPTSIDRDESISD
jgi:hypothetical protein